MADDLRVPFDICQDAFGVPGSVTRPAPDDDPIDTVLVWSAPAPIDTPAQADYTRRAARRIIGISLDDVPTVPTETIIVAPEALGGDIQTWKVDAIDRLEFDHVRAIVRRVS